MGKIRVLLFSPLRVGNWWHRWREQGLDLRVIPVCDTQLTVEKIELKYKTKWNLDKWVARRIALHKFVPNEEYVIIAGRFLAQCGKRKILTRDYSAYKLKHIVECWSGSYIDVESFCVAAVQMGFVGHHPGYAEGYAGTEIYFNIGIPRQILRDQKLITAKR